jgi:hypothetical protein
MPSVVPRCQYVCFHVCVVFLVVPMSVSVLFSLYVLCCLLHFEHVQCMCHTRMKGWWSKARCMCVSPFSVTAAPDCLLFESGHGRSQQGRS